MRMPSVPPAAIAPVDERVRVAELLHGRIGDLGHGGGGGDRGAADRAEAGAGDDRRHREPAAQMADEGVGGAEQLLRHAGARDEVAHQDEQRHHRQRVVAPGLVDLGLHHRHGGREVPVAQIGDAEEADHAHGDARSGCAAAQAPSSAEADQGFGHVGLTLSGSNWLGAPAPGRNTLTDARGRSSPSSRP